MAKKTRYVWVTDSQGKAIPLDKSGEEVVAVLVVDQNGKVLHAVQYDVVAIEKAVAKAKTKGTSETTIARELTTLGADVQDRIWREISKALKRRAKPKRAEPRR